MSDSKLTLPEGIEKQARSLLDGSIMLLDGEPVGTVAARDARHEAVNYHHCFVRDFAVSAAVFLQEGRHDIVRRFLSLMIDLQSRNQSMDCFDPGRGLMPASFLVRKRGGREEVVADFGAQAIARVTPVDSAFWWILLLRMYTRRSGDRSLLEDPATQDAIRLIMDFSLTTQVELLPTLLVPDGAFMIDRRMGVYGHPLDVQVLFFAALRAAREMLPDDDSYQKPITERIAHVAHHLDTYYWTDLDRLNALNRFPVEEYGEGVVNHFNIYPESIPNWVLPWVPDDGGYYAANLGAGRIDFRFMAQGNLLAVLTGLAEASKAEALAMLLEQRWEDLVGVMPMKLCFPSLEGSDWALLTGRDAKNRPWSYHNGGSWPCLLWLLVPMLMKLGREDLARRATELAARRIAGDQWPEYYDTPKGRLIGRQARLRQTWTAAGLLVAINSLRDPVIDDLFDFDEEVASIECKGPADLSVRADAALDLESAGGDH